MRIATKIRLNRYDRDFNLLERREQNCQSFVKQIWELLYTQAAQIDKATPRIGPVDTAGQIRRINAVADQPFAQGGDIFLKAALMVQAPGGEGMVYAPGGNDHANISAGGCLMSWQGYMLRGENVGICLGASDTAVAPNDARLVDRISHGVRTAEAVSIMMQANQAADTSQQTTYGTNPRAVIFTALRGFKLASVKLKLYRNGNPGTLTVSLSGCDGTFKSGYENRGPVPYFPSPLASATTNGDTLTNVSPGEIREFTFASPIDIIPGIYYALTLTMVGGAGGGPNVLWRTSPSHTVNGMLADSSDSGATWTTTSDLCPYYELWGTSQPELEYGGCDCRHIVAADPNASFEISRLFYNNTGGNVDIKECGIQAVGFNNAITLVGTNYASWEDDALSFLIARDVIAPTITLNDGQVLQVTYTPAVTV